MRRPLLYLLPGGFIEAGGWKSGFKKQISNMLFVRASVQEAITLEVDSASKMWKSHIGRFCLTKGIDPKKNLPTVKLNTFL